MQTNIRAHHQANISNPRLYIVHAQHANDSSSQFRIMVRSFHGTHDSSAALSVTGPAVNCLGGVHAKAVARISRTRTSVQRVGRPQSCSSRKSHYGRVTNHIKTVQLVVVWRRIGDTPRRGASKAALSASNHVSCKKLSEVSRGTSRGIGQAARKCGCGDATNELLQVTRHNCLDNRELRLSRPPTIMVLKRNSLQSSTVSSMYCSVCSALEW